MSNIKISEDIFDIFSDESGKTQQIKRFTLSNKNKVSVQIINYGATITSINVPDRNGSIGDVVLGFDDMKGYIGSNNPYFGAVVGRVANRIGKGKFRIGNEEHNVTLNRGTYHLHGGKKGFDKVVWDSNVDDDKLTFAYLSKHDEEGYPGDVIVQATYQLNSCNELRLNMTAMSTRATPINLTNHSYFNLAGHNAGNVGISEHTLHINADKYVEVDHESIPTGKLNSLSNTSMDLRIARSLGDVLAETKGIDHCYCINQNAEGDMSLVARAAHPPSGRVMEIHSDQPGVQLYTSNFLPDPSAGDKLINGKNGVHYMKQGAFCLETQNYPDAINHTNFPNSILNPGYTYTHSVLYQFGVLN